MSRKLALIIGNNNYSYKPLINCANDAIRLADVLRPIENCRVELKTNLESANMYECIKNFTTLIKPDDFIIFFFAGHGIQRGDQNYLLPCDDNKIRNGDDIERYGINVQLTVNRMAAKSPHIVLFLLDCCRSYLMPSKASGDRGHDQQIDGLNKMAVPPQTLIAFASAAGEVVSGRSANSSNGLFTKYLLKRITTPNEHIETVLRRVANDVAAETNNLQTLFQKSRIVGEVYLVTKDRSGQRPKDDAGSGISSPNSEVVRTSFEHPNHMVADSSSQRQSYPVITFGLNASTDQNVKQLFEHLKSLRPMDKYGSMSGDCDCETTQMENFLKENFGFKNLHGEYIVQGVKSFKLSKPLSSMEPNTVIYFPTKSGTKRFAMTVSEIIQWQESYAVYADGRVPGMSREFLQQALRGLSSHGEEAARMKFVVRISQCPILMEFDAKIIRREINETWPRNIKLVSVTGVDFAGRIHDVDDIRTYILNWRSIYEIDRARDLPRVYNGRDFRRVRDGPRAELDEQRLFNDLKRMARIRLNACDDQRVQIVVETGIGLGVFAGKGIGIDDRVRTLSALAIREALEQDGNRYRSIRGIVFALPVFDMDRPNQQRQDTYYAFSQVFDKKTYQGRIPVLIADQDMHRLTVAIARQGFIVSELNPADSHGVFGEYWQNRGPAVEEKLALTTVGLLVQHHLINPYVLDQSHYHLI